MKRLCTIMLLICCIAAKPAAPPDAAALPAWLVAMIEAFKREPVANPPRTVEQYIYKGAIVYFVSSDCCDQFEQLYSADGAAICAPSGGRRGNGNGQCPDFGRAAIHQKQIWHDPRKR